MRKRYTNMSFLSLTALSISLNILHSVLCALHPSSFYGKGKKEGKTYREKSPKTGTDSILKWSVPSRHLYCTFLPWHINGFFKGYDHPILDISPSHFVEISIHPLSTEETFLISFATDKTSYRFLLLGYTNFPRHSQTLF